MQIIDVAKLALLFAAAILLIRRWSRFRGTTLVAPAAWSVLALVLIAATDLTLALTQWLPSTGEKIRYLAGTSTFCPLMAVLGAKRPQDKGWQWIVISLWIVLILPVAQSFIWRGGELEIGPFRRWFMVILMLVGFFNYALTRFGIAALLITVGQALLLLPFLPIVSREWPESWLLGVLLVVASIGMTYWQTRRGPEPGTWNDVWIDFRNAFGLVWGLRVMERINTTAKLCDWESELSWFGFDKIDDRTTSDHELERTIQTLLRRFVSQQWIAERKSPG